MIILFRIFVVIFIIAFFAWLIILFTDWHDNTSFHYPKIKFVSFKKFYEINPNRWKLRKAAVECVLEGYKVETFRFGFLDYLEYELWIKQQEQNSEQERHNRATKRMMDAVKQDIANSEAHAKAMQNKALDDLAKWAAENDTNLDIKNFIEEYKKIHERKNL